MDYSQPDTGDTKGHANGNAHADSRLTYVATGHVGPPIQSSADHDDEAATGVRGLRRRGQRTERPF